jgi:hypothetical protein
LALLYLVMHDEDDYGAEAWKGFDWDTMNRLHERGFIGNPVGKTKSVVVKLPAHPVKTGQARRGFPVPLKAGCPLTPPIPPKRDGARSGHTGRM